MARSQSKNGDGFIGSGKGREFAERYFSGEDMDTLCPPGMRRGGGHSCHFMFFPDKRDYSSSRAAAAGIEDLLQIYGSASMVRKLLGTPREKVMAGPLSLSRQMMLYPPSVLLGECKDISLLMRIAAAHRFWQTRTTEKDGLRTILETGLEYGDALFKCFMLMSARELRESRLDQWRTPPLMTLLECLRSLSGLAPLTEGIRKRFGDDSKILQDIITPWEVARLYNDLSPDPIPEKWAESLWDFDMIYMSPDWFSPSPDDLLMEVGMEPPAKNSTFLERIAAEIKGCTVPGTDPGSEKMFMLPHVIPMIFTPALRPYLAKPMDVLGGESIFDIFLDISGSFGKRYGNARYPGWAMKFFKSIYIDGMKRLKGSDNEITRVIMNSPELRKRASSFLESSPGKTRSFAKLFPGTATALAVSGPLSEAEIGGPEEMGL